MKALNLQINDYVYTPDEKLAQVVSIIYDAELNAYIIVVKVGSENLGYLEEELKPILIVASMFKWSSYKFRDFNTYNINYNLFWQDGHICTTDNYRDNIQLFDCRYVHQFQHIMSMLDMKFDLNLSKI